MVARIRKMMIDIQNPLMPESRTAALSEAAPWNTV